MTGRVPFTDLGATHQELAGELEAAFARVAASGWYLLGAELEAFEREFASYCGTEHCVGLGSGMSAIELTLRAAGIGPGAEVIVPAYTWVATWLAVTATGARPVGVDAAQGGYNIDPGGIEAALSDRTAAILPVHMCGEPADMEAIGAIAARRGLTVIEDAAQAHGAATAAGRVGSLGDAAAFSFYPTKNLGALGDGGAVTTDDAGLAERLRLFRNYGMRDRYDIEYAGAHSRLDELQAAMLRVKLPHLDRWNEARAALAERYAEALGESDEIEAPRSSPGSTPAWHLFVIGHPDREGCREALAEQGIEALVHYPVLPHMSGPYREGPGGPGAFPVAERRAARALSLPLHPHLTEADCDRVAGAVLGTVGGATARSA